MSDISQGPGWWQASDLKWYPPELHADYVAPRPPVTPTLPPPPKLPPAPTPVTTKGPSGQRTVGFVIAGLALLAIAVEVVLNRALALPIAGVIAIIGVTIAVRSGQSHARKVIFVVAMVLVVLALPVILLFGGGPSHSPSSPGPASAGVGQQLCDKFHVDNPPTGATISEWTVGEVTTGKSWAQIKQELRAAMAVCPDITSAVQQSNQLTNSD
jgi:hypothetical protein